MLIGGNDTMSITSLMRDLESGLLQLPLATAIAALDAWHDRLSATDDPGLHAVADELQVLSVHLTRSPLDARVLGLTISRLGELSLAAAPLASSTQERAAVERLGHLLHHAGHALRGPIPSQSSDTSLSPS